MLGNWGLIISIIILVVLLFFSYNKCMVSTFDEEFTDDSTSTPTSTSSNSDLTSIQSNPQDSQTAEFPEPQNPRINISGTSISLNFIINLAAGSSVPTQFMVVLVQYDSNLTPTGNNKFYISNESVINPNSGISVIPNATEILSAKNNSLCQLVNGSPSCQYVFNNIDIIDTNGNPYYYKIGISAVYTNGNSPFVLPYNVVNSNGIFSLATSLDTQNNQFNDYIKNKQMQNRMSSTNYSSASATPDGQYELIKSQLGGYPSNLFMDPQSSKQNLLADLVDKSMAQALLNVNVSLPSTTNATVSFS